MSEETFRWAVTIGVWVAAICIVVMAGAVIALYGVASKVRKRVDEMKARVEPIIDTARKVINENAPKVSVIADNVVDISGRAKEIAAVATDQAHRFAEVGSDIAARARVRVARVDTVVDETVEQVHHAGDNVKAAVMKPVREASAVLAGVKAAVSTLVDGRRPTVDHITQDEEMFI